MQIATQTPNGTAKSKQTAAKDSTPKVREAFRKEGTVATKMLGYKVLFELSLTTKIGSTGGVPEKPSVQFPAESTTLCWLEVLMKGS